MRSHQMHNDLRNGWVGHHAQLDGEAHQWEVERGAYDEHLGHARQMLQIETLERNPEYSPRDEAQHHARVITLLRAAKNAKSDTHARSVCAWIGHRAEDVAAEAAIALSAHESEATEQLLLERVSSQLEESRPASQRQTRVTKQLLKTLIAWEGTGAQSLSEAIRHPLLGNPLADRWRAAWLDYGLPSLSSVW